MDIPEYRNAKIINENTIDCEINHPAFGWIPFTCNTSDTGARIDVKELYRRMAADPATKPMSDA